MKISNSVTLKVLKIHIQQFIKRANTKCDICFYVLKYSGSVLHWFIYYKKLHLTHKYILFKYSFMETGDQFT